AARDSTGQTRPRPGRKPRVCCDASYACAFWTGCIARMQCTRRRVTALIWLWGVQSMATDGLVSLRSSNGPKETMSRLEAEVKAMGLTVFARVDHSAGAADVGLQLRPTDLLIFGNAKAGTPLMQSV